MAHTAREFVEPAKEKLAFLQEQIELLRPEADAFDEDIARVAALQTKTRDELAAYLLGDVEDQTLATLEERLRYPELLKIKREFETRLAAAQAELARLEELEDVKNYDFHVSRADDELEEIRPAYEALSRARTKWMSLSGMEELITEGYLRDGYRPNLWRRLGDWVRVSAVLDDLDAWREAHTRGDEPTAPPEQAVSDPAGLRAA